MVLMRSAKTNPIPTRLRTFVLTALIAIGLICAPDRPGIAEEPAAYAIEVNDVTAKVGEHAVMHVTLRVRDGYRILESYRNRVIKLSVEDDGVAFDQEVVPATAEEGALLFAVGFRATKPGKHPINGLFRVGYIRGAGEMAMVSLPLIATVTGTE
jgi:hypothetical protein